MLITRKPGLNPVLLFKKKQRIAIGEKQVFFHFGRGAIYHIFRSLGLNNNDIVLFPAYICDTALQPLIDLNITVKFYKLDSSLNVDLNDVNEKLSAKTRVLFIIHYFGFPQNVEQIRAFCDENNLILIEDCAHVLPLPGTKQTLGSLGDFSFFSLRKYYPVSGVGILLINNFQKNISLSNQSVPGRLLMLKYAVNDFIKYVEFKTSFFSILRSGYSLKGTQHNKADLFNNGKYNSGIYSLGMHGASWNLVRRMDFEQTARIRRRNYNYMLEILKGFEGIEIIFKHLPPQIVPMVFPVYTQHGKRICNEVKDIDIFLWPTLHSVVMHSNEPSAIQAKEYSARILLLPLHEGLRKNHLDLVCDSIGRYCQQNS